MFEFLERNKALFYPWEASGDEDVLSYDSSLKRVFNYSDQISVSQKFFWLSSLRKKEFNLSTVDSLLTGQFDLDAIVVRMVDISVMLIFQEIKDRQVEKTDNKKDKVRLELAYSTILNNAFDN